MIFLTAFFLRPYAFWLAGAVAAIIYGSVGMLLWHVWSKGYHWAVGIAAVLVLATAWKYAQILNQEIATAETLECDALLWILRVPGIAGRALYTASNLGAGALVFLGIELPTKLLGASPLLSLPPALALGVWAIVYRLRHHPMAQQFTFTGIRR